MFPFVVYADSPGTIGRFFLQRFKYRPRSYCLRSANVRRQAEKMIKGDELMKKKILLIVLCLVAALMVFAACDGEPKVYSVTFELDGGVVEGRDLSAGLEVEEDSVLQLENYAPQKEGYDFKGWSAGSVEYSASDSIIIKGDITLVAHYTLKSYDVVFDAGEGKMTGADSLKAEHGYTLALSDYVAEPSDSDLYSFVGWKSGSTDYAADANVAVTQPLTFTARYEMNFTPAEMFEFSQTEEEGKVKLSGLADGFDGDIVVLPATDAEGNKITEIGAYAFSYSDVKKVYLDGAVELETIGSSAFSNCGELEFVSLKGLSKLTTVSSSAFVGRYPAMDTKLKTVDFSGCVSLEFIGQKCFEYQTQLTEIDLSECESLQSIERDAFKLCSSLKKVSLPYSLRYIGGYSTYLESENADMFGDCDALESIEIDGLNPYFTSDGGIMYTADKTQLINFPAACGVKEYTAPASLQRIWDRAFENAVLLESVNLEACSLSFIGFNAFAGIAEQATVAVSFDERGYYQDGTLCELGRGWNGSATVSYGEKYYFFEETFVGIADEMTTAKTTLEFTASVNYGEYDCQISVYNNTAQTNGTVDGKNCSVSLVLGENEIVVTAVCVEKNNAEKSWSFAVEKTEQLQIGSSLQKDGLNRETDGSTFTVTVKDADGNAVSVKDRLSIAVDCGMSAPNFTTLSEGFNYTVTYSANDTVAEIALDFDNLLTMWYEVEDNFKLAVSFSVSQDETLREEYEMIYIAPPQFSVAGIADGDKISGDITLTITAKDSSGAPISSDRLTLKMVASWGTEYTVPFTVVSEENGVITVKVSYSDISSKYMMIFDAFTFVATLSDENGNEIARVEFKNVDVA